MIITFISDTHTKHRDLDGLLPKGDILIHAGDFMNSGYKKLEIEFFCAWFEKQPYTHKIFIAGNHDRLFELKPKKALEIVNEFNVTYLQDAYTILEDGTLVYGSPHTPEFCNWSFNLPRNGKELKEKWDNIPPDTDILITHGPALDHLDVSGEPWNNPRLGCELLRARIDKYPPKIHVFGHIHGSAGYKFHNGTHFINAAVLNERYNYKGKPITIEWDPETNEIKFL